VATTETKSWWTPIIITFVGFLLLFTGFWIYVPGWLLDIASFILGAFLILIILIQRGKGGGLAGAFGGVGGSSPFGSRAGDAFTRYTITIATLWLWVTLLHVKVIQESALPASQAAAQASSKS
jgi:preprotein translocase subunit SecG